MIITVILKPQSKLDCNDFETYFHQYWSIIAQTFSNYSSVLSYELINEPWAGNIYEFPLFALPGVAGALNLMPLLVYL